MQNNQKEINFNDLLLLIRNRIMYYSALVL